MPQHSPQFAPFAARMQTADLPELFINTFAHYYEQLRAGVTGLIPEREIKSVTSLPDAEQISDEMAKRGEAVLAKTAVIKLNGGLGTSMGLEGAKSLLTVKNSLSFLDIIARQAIHLGVPLILMDSFSTQEDSLAVLRQYPELICPLPQSFLQHKEPKIRQADLSPVEWLVNPALEWCPPGHGDIYAALITSGTLDALLARGYEYAFVSNADNLGAVVDTGILGYFASQQIPFLMEVADRTEMDRKGGHLARWGDGRSGSFGSHLLLRESAQCPDEDEASFQDITRHKFFNTNNLWLHLPFVKQVMETQAYNLRLPLICNRKTVDPRDHDSTPVYQLETAMGSAVSVFRDAQAIRVPRNRFAPVKTTNELLLVRSDLYNLTRDFRVIPADLERVNRFVLVLDGAHYRFVSDLEAQFPQGVPSLADCTRFEVQGEVCFGRNVICQGEVSLINQSGQPVSIADGAVLQGTRHF